VRKLEGLPEEDEPGPGDEAGGRKEG
jgi:hypothetical protein